MNRYLKKLYHFLGGVVFAILLIVLTATLVITGTFMESSSGSHQYATLTIYDSVSFSLLLWGFFLNILFAALRRWPFKKQHIPFLITHLGLLMILGGVLIKRHYGVQGTMFLVEGGATDQLMIPESHALRIDTKGNSSSTYAAVPLKGIWTNVSGLTLRTVFEFPHSKEYFDTFIKGEKAYIQGLPTLPLDTPVHAFLDNTDWTLIAAKPESTKQFIAEIYSKLCTLRLSDPLTQETVKELSLEKALSAPFVCGGKNVSTTLDLAPLSAPHPNSPTLSVSCEGRMITIPLAGNHVLANLLDDPLLGAAPFEIDLAMNPVLLFLQGPNGETTLIAVGKGGDIDHQTLRPESMPAAYVYDHGFRGYGATVTLHHLKHSRQELEAAQVMEVKSELAKAKDHKEDLLPPLQLLFDACQKAQVDFAETLFEYLLRWHQSGSWLYPTTLPLTPLLQKAFFHFDWQLLSQRERKGCFWSSALTSKLEVQAEEGSELLQLLELYCWPFLDALKSEPNNGTKRHLLDIFTHQVFAVADDLPAIPEHLPSPEESGWLFSAFCRNYGIHLGSLLPSSWSDTPTEKVVLESPLTTRYAPLSPTLKPEENTPLLIMELDSLEGKRQLALAYDRQAQGLKWPAGNGTHLLRFQPLHIPLPYEVRLRRGRQISYPGTDQPYSYEAELAIREKNSKGVVETTISMNNVYETWDGYRFYLAAMSPSNEASAKHVQLAVNLDPAKYTLTYPGAIILSMGIVLLFWLRPYKKH